MSIPSDAASESDDEMEVSVNVHFLPYVLALYLTTCKFHTLFYRVACML